MTSRHLRQVLLLGPKIRELRRARHLTQTELASRVGIQQSDLSRIERGRYRVSLDTLFRLLAEFEMGVGEFFDEVASSSLSGRDAALLRRFGQLDPDSQREVESFVRFKARQPQKPGPREH